MTFSWVMDKNHNPRKGTETSDRLDTFLIRWELDKNHNPRKGTETFGRAFLIFFFASDKNHNPRKGTETIFEKDFKRTPKRRR